MSSILLKSAVQTRKNQGKVAFAVAILSVICITSSAISFIYNQKLLKVCSNTVTGKIINVSGNSFIDSVIVSFVIDETEYKTRGDAKWRQSEQSSMIVHCEPGNPRRSYAGEKPPVASILKNGGLGLFGLICSVIMMKRKQ